MRLDFSAYYFCTLIRRIVLLRALEYFVTISGSIGLFVEISRVELFLLFSPLPFMSLLAYFVSSVCIYLSNEKFLIISRTFRFK